MPSSFESLESSGAQSCTFYSHSPSGLRAFLAVDSTTLGPAAGGIRTWRYSNPNEAVEDALALARAMTLKCALADLDAGGAKMVVMDHPGLDRPRAFAWLGRRVEELAGSFITAGDLGTGPDDLEVMAKTTRFVHTDAVDLSGAVGETVAHCMRACAEQRGLQSLQGLAIAIQGCGSIGSAVARKLAQIGARILLADVDTTRAKSLAEELGAETVSPESVLTSAVDIVAPCAKGGVLTHEVAREMSAWAVCGGANNMLSSEDVEDALMERDVLCVPDVLSSSGAVIAGVARTVMGLSNFQPLLERTGDKAKAILENAQERGERANRIARKMAHERIAAAAAAQLK